MSDRPQDTPIYDPPASDVDVPPSDPAYASTQTARSFEDYETAEPSRGDVAREQAGQTADTAKTEARNVAGTAKDQAGRVADEAREQGRNLMQQAASEAKQQAHGQTQRAAGVAQSIAGQFRALSEGRADEAGEVGRYMQQVSDQIESFATSLDQRGFDGLVDDLSSFARRRPGVFLISAATAGFLTGRLLRGARDASSSSTSITRTTTTSTPATTPVTTGTEPVTTGAEPVPTEPTYVVPDAPEAPLSGSRLRQEGL